MDLCGKSSGFVDFAENTVDRGSTVIFDADSGFCLSWCSDLGPKTKFGSFFSFDRYVNEFIQVTSFFERSSFKLRYETVIGIVLCCSYQACCLLYHLGEINSGIHMYQFIFETLHFCQSDVVIVSDLNKNFGGSTDLVKKRHGWADFHPYSPPMFLTRACACYNVGSGFS